MAAGRRKVLIIVGVLAVVAILAVGTAVLVVLRRDVEARAYLDTVLPEIAGSWDPQTLLDQGAKEFHQSVSRAQVEGLCATLAEKLGALKSYKGSRGHVRITTTNRGIVVSGNYAAGGEFEHASAIISVGIVRRGGRWRIVDFYVTSDVLP